MENTNWKSITQWCKKKKKDLHGNTQLRMRMREDGGEHWHCPQHPAASEQPEGLMLPRLWVTMEDEKGKYHEARQGQGVSMAERCRASS